MSLIKQTSSVQRIGRPFAFRRSIGDYAEDTRPTSPSTQNLAAQVLPDQADELEALRSRVSQLSDELEAAKAETSSARAEANAEGYEKGLRDAVSQEKERATLLSQAIEDALVSIDQRLDGERDLAIELALATLSTILGDSGRQSELVLQTACKWAEMLKSSKVLRVQVSGADFSEDSNLSSLCDRLGRMAVEVDQTLPSGSCLFDLELGHVDASIPVQAKAAQDFLMKHANSPETAG
ncbi:FliH/SctL family protein [Altererythrobacter sp. Z27]|uniref:FliH/SctL family protein n=1 Tax=Altererythrobacter sp. Z27 TaxID=3461147 RepID=UPI00404416E9